VNDLTLICETCNFPVTGDSGSLYVTYADIHTHEAAETEWEERHPAGTAIDITELLEHPGDIHWRTGHDRCRADRDLDCYEIDDVQICSWPQLARWTAHLMGKNWFALTDWDDLLRELSGEARSRRIRVAAKEAA
jgi:hypothetical protein